MILKMCRENSREKKCIVYFKKGIGQKNNTKWRIKTMAVDNIVLKKKKRKRACYTSTYLLFGTQI